MLRFLIVVLLVIPFIDLYLLIEVSGLMGFWTVIALVLLTGMIGAELIRREGRHVLLKLQRSVTSGEVSRNVAEGAIIVLCGLLLLTPGFLTDIIGFLLIFRPLRERLVAKLVSGTGSSMNFEVRTF
jgi:UPF0716 protein FxsA